MNADAWLESHDGRTIPVQGNCGLGRAQDNQVVVGEQGVSRRHALIHAQGAGEYWLVDLGSRNGTYLNGRRLGLPTQLRHGDRIQVGGGVFVFHRPVDPVVTTMGEGESMATVVQMRMVPCWLLVADVIGSTRMSTGADPQEAARLIGHWLADCRDLIEKKGGSINKFLGDGFFAYWPASFGNPDEMIEALVTLRAAAGQGRPPFRLALHKGEVIIGGTASMGEEDLSGPEVNFVFRMEKLASALFRPAIASRSVCEALAGRFDFEPLGKHPLAGFPGEHEMMAW